MEWKDLIQTRRSCREYLGGQITTAQLKEILQAGCAAPVARGQYENLQLTVVQDPAMLRQIDDAVRQAAGDASVSCTRGAPTVILISAREQEGQISPMMVASAACVMENMHLAAVDLGLGSVCLGSIQMASSSLEVMYKLELQDGFWPVLALAVGDAAQAAEKREIPMTKIFTNILESEEAAPSGD